MSPASRRFLDLSSDPVAIRFANRCIVLHWPNDHGRLPMHLPVDELESVVLSEPTITVSAAALAQMVGAGVAVVLCDAKRLPVGMMVPLAGHFVHSERLRDQLAVKRPKAKRLWQTVVKAKLAAQSACLLEFTGDDSGLRVLARQVKSGDPDNREAVAAVRYWRQLMQPIEARFRRDRDLPGINTLLNYGYAVVRASVARAVCAVGLHPAIGLQHKNRYNPFCLVDDVLEPFRPLVDAVVVRAHRAGLEIDLEQPLTSEWKRRLLGTLTERYLAEDEKRTALDWIQVTSQRLMRAISGKDPDWRIPILGAPEQDV